MLDCISFKNHHNSNWLCFQLVQIAKVGLLAREGFPSWFSWLTGLIACGFNPPVVRNSSVRIDREAFGDQALTALARWGTAASSPVVLISHSEVMSLCCCESTSCGDGRVTPCLWRSHMDPPALCALEPGPGVLSCSSGKRPCPVWNRSLTWSNSVWRRLDCSQTQLSGNDLWWKQTSTPSGGMIPPARASMPRGFGDLPRVDGKCYLKHASSKVCHRASPGRRDNLLRSLGPSSSWLWRSSQVPLSLIYTVSVSCTISQGTLAGSSALVLWLPFSGLLYTADKNDTSKGQKSAVFDLITKNKRNALIWLWGARERGGWQSVD